MNVETLTDREQPSPSHVGRLESLCDRFEEAWRDGDRPSLEEFLEGQAESPVLLRELLILEVAYRRRSGERPRYAEYIARFPEHGSTIQEVFAAVEDGKDISTLFRGNPESGNAGTRPAGCRPAGGSGAAGSPRISPLSFSGGRNRIPDQWNHGKHARHCGPCGGGHAE